jgi:predicted nucleic acid-binding protein
VRIWRNLRQQGAVLFTTDYIVDQTLTLLKTRAGAEVAIRGGESILSSRVVKMVKGSDEIFSMALNIFRKYTDHPFSFTDCTSFEVMRKVGLTKAYTFDFDFRVMGFEVLAEGPLKMY